VNDRLREWSDGYTVALGQYLSEPEELALTRAYELGREALADGLGVLEIATVHSQALAAVLDRPLNNGERTMLLDALEKFFVEVLSPFEMAHRGFRDANVVLHRLNEVLEGQARRIASALHDEAAQLLASVHLALADVAVKPPTDVAKGIQNVRGLLDQIEARLRLLSHEIRPPILDDLGLVPALEFLADSVSKRWGLSVTVDASLDRTLPGTVETTLYRLSQEALTNVAKHAKASTAKVLLQRAEHKVACSITDDGVGFDPTASGGRKRSHGLGLVEMQERVNALGGVLNIGRNDAGGTTVSIEIPLEG